jgi:hypothetical protein
MTTKQKSEDELNDEAIDLLSSAAADKFARALDRCGWMIVTNPELAAEYAAARLALGPWFMNGPGECPAWAEPWWSQNPPMTIPFPKPRTSP